MSDKERSMNSNYVGVTGFMAREEVTAVLDALPASCAAPLMIGALCSSKTLDGLPNKWPGRYPEPAAIAGIFSDDPRALNLIHFATDRPSSLSQDLFRLIKIGGPHLHGFQLNGPWPVPFEIEMVLEACPYLRVVLQIKPGLPLVARDATGVSLARYRDLVTDVLIDGNGGRGTPLDARAVIESVRGVREAFGQWPVRIGVAGGLCAERIPEVLDIARLLNEPATGTLSVDAEGRLRTADDKLDIDAARAYVRAAAELFPSRTGGAS